MGNDLSKLMRIIVLNKDYSKKIKGKNKFDWCDVCDNPRPCTCP